VERRWEAGAVGPDGIVQPIDFAALPRGYRGSVKVLRQLAVSSPSARDEVCRAWADEVQRTTGQLVVEVEVSSLAVDLRNGRAVRARAFTCGRRP